MKVRAGEKKIFVTGIDGVLKLVVYIIDVVTITGVSRIEHFGAERVDSKHLPVLVEAHGVAWQLAGVAQRREPLLYGLCTNLLS